MPDRIKRWIFPCCVLVATCFGVFVLPFFFPPPYLAGVSVANVAGFNNKVAYLAAAALSVFVFLVALKWPWMKRQYPVNDHSRLSRRLLLITIVIFSGFLTLVCWIVVRSDCRYLNDWGYFIRQISMHADYGRKVYEQIEFPYGPLIFYGPILVRAILSPFHVSLTWSYNITLVIESIIGLLSVAYVIENLPMLRKWKTVLFLICAVGAVQANLGLNFTFFRFMFPPAFLVLGIRRRKPWAAAACFLVGQLISLAMSPEMGVAFVVSSVAYSAYFCYMKGRVWLIAAMAPLVATAGFLLLMDRSYLLMLQLFAKGINNFIVEPLPHVLIYLFALVWLVPCLLARFFRDQNPEAPMLAALYIFAVGLLPAAFGSVDPGHVFFNGILILFLSMVAISAYGPRQQTVWAVCLAGLSAWQVCISIKLWHYQWRPALGYGILHYQPMGLGNAALTFARTGSLTAAKQRIYYVGQDHSFDIEKLDALVGKDPVATPLELPPSIEEALRRTGQFTPSQYISIDGVVYDGAEDRDIEELNRSHWALLPKGGRMHWSESTADTRFALGIQLPYRDKHPPYTIGDHFNENMATHWQPYGEVGNYVVYRRRS
jgi:hypothetical protein